MQDALDDTRHTVEVDFATIYGSIMQGEFEEALQEVPIEIAADFQVW